MTTDGGPGSHRIAERELVFLLGAISATTALGIDMALPAFATKVTIGSTLAVMFDMGSFVAFLGSSQLLFDDVYGRGDVFAFYFAGMSLFMGLVVFTGGRQVTRIGADRAIVVLLPTTLVLSMVLALWARQHRPQPAITVPATER
ncbi:hypothetical protein [Candidatus Poriferisodalis sp.]|uniref:hypothetical protein n=1 Tax=Candidatus Poriferisodalis sp. TaxID=3101277 RepID=UPI003B51AD7E